MIVYISLLVCVIGLVIYFIATKGEVKEAGRLAYFAGLLAFLLQLSPKMVDLFK